MKREEILDHVLDLPGVRGRRVQVEDEAIAGCVEAAERVRELEGVDVPVEVAARVEQMLRAHLRSASLQPQSQISLNREYIVPLPPPRRTHTPARSGRRARFASLVAAAVLVLAFTGLLAFSAHLLPGQSTTGPQAAVVQGTRDPQAQLQNALTQLQNALSDLQTAAGDQALSMALQAVAARTNECRAAADEIADTSQRTAAQRNLTRILGQEEQILRQWLPTLDWSLRLRFTHQLGVLGDPVPTLTHMSVQVQVSGTVLLTLIGTHFTPQTLFLSNGQPAGHVRFVSSQQLVVVLSSAQFSPGSHSIGVLNPDGTAAQLAQREDDDVHGTGTPYPDN